MNKLFVGLCASVCLLSLATDAQAVRLGGRTTIRPHRSYTRLRELIGLRL